MAELTDLAGRKVRNIDLSGTTVIGADLRGARFSGEITGLVINDVEVAPLIDAELTRRFPERAQLRPTDAAGARAAWDVIESLWSSHGHRVKSTGAAAGQRQG